MSRSRTRCAAAVLGLMAACPSPLTPPGQVVLGSLNLTGELASSTCPFDAHNGQLIDQLPNGSLALDGGGLSPLFLDTTWTLSITPAEGRLYLTNANTQRQGDLDGGAFSLSAGVLRSVCGNVWVVETLTGDFYGPPQSPGPDGTCPLFSGPGRFPDGGIWSLAYADGGASNDAGGDAGLDLTPSVCFSPAGVVAGASLTDTFSILPDAGFFPDAGPDGGDLCSDAAFIESCVTAYAMQGKIGP